MERYRYYKNENKFDIYEVTGRYIVSCTNETTAKQLVYMMNNEKGVPANDNSILNTLLAKATRKLLGKDK